MNMEEQILKLLQERYFLKNEKSWEDIAKRVSSIFPEIYDDILNKNFIPSSPTLMNCNTNGERIGTLSSCFPMNLVDSIEGIFESLGECAKVTKYAGGIGIDASNLRSSNESIKGIGGRKSSGALSFINIFNSMLDGISQMGTRRGAGMVLLSIYNPDILKFIHAKTDETKFNRFNFSIKIPNSFYDRLEKEPNSIHLVKNIVDKQNYPLMNEHGKEVSTKELWDIIINQSYKTAEPGIFNESMAFERCTVTNINKNVICNPCSEFTGIPYQSCNLGSINLSHLINKKNEFDWIRFENIISNATLFLNKIIDNNNYPINKIKDITTATRPIGLGVMGLAHLFFKLKIPYNSKKALSLTNDIFKYLTLKSMQKSVELAKDFGYYSAYDESIFLQANRRFFENKEKFYNIDIEKLIKDIKKYGVYNSSNTSIAPTGTISYLCNTSGGIEPIFSLLYSRKIEKENKEYEIVNIFDPVFKQYLDENFLEKEQKIIIDEIKNNNGSCQKSSIIPEEIKKIFVTANDLKPIEHLDLLECVANNISLSVSKTINLPENISIKEVSDVFLEAHKKGIIGVTIFREGSRKAILSSQKDNPNRLSPKRPKSLPCHVYKIKVQGNDWRVFVGLLDNKPYEIFSGKVQIVDLPSSMESGIITKIKKGVYQFEYNNEVLIKDITTIFQSTDQEALTRQISTNLRHSIPIEFIVEQLSKSYGTISDFNKSIVRALKKYIKDNVKSSIKCSSCDTIMVYQEGCVTCPNCGISHCG
jgi:ribonucleoside-diphosphate reductase alpha chain